MKKIIVFLLLLPTAAFAQRLELSAKAGISINSKDLSAESSSFITQQAWGMGYNIGIKALWNFSHFQAGISLEALSTSFKIDETPIDGGVMKFHFQPAITPALVFNYKMHYAYIGVDAAPVFTNVSTNYLSSWDNTTTTASEFHAGIMGGIHVGYYLPVAKHWSLNPELGIRYYRISEATASIPAIAIPLTIGIVHK
jgi:hypothetical protein